MYLKKKSSLFRTVTFRLTLWYVALFGMLLFVVFLVIYIVLTSGLGQRTDEYLLSTAKEFEALYSTDGIEALRAEFQRESESKGIKRVFYRFFSPQQEVLVSSELSSWSELGALPIHPIYSSNGEVMFETISVPGQRHKVRTIFKKTVNAHIIQIGATLQENESLMEKYRETFIIALGMLLFCGGFVGWIVARRAMSGVERVAQTAVRIGKGNLSRRVPLWKKGQEIDDLAMAFNDMLERIQALVREMKEVTDNIAHDLLSPITCIRGIAETTLTGEQNLNSYREMAGMVVEESDRLVEIINTMLEIARTDSGVAELSKETVDVGKIIHDACELFLPMAEEQGIRLELDAPMKPLTVLGDLARLQRVVANLLDNAIKFTPAGGKVLVSAQAIDSQAKVEVIDTGVGITNKELPRIFERFYRGDRSRSTPGNGLGLSLAKAIVQAYNGDIIVKSSPGKGSKFIIVLPLKSSK